MRKAINDPLLIIAKLVLGFLMGVCAFAAFFVLLGAVALPIFQGDIVVELAAEGKKALPGEFIPLTSLLLALIAGLLVMFIYFLLLLWRIVATVGEGDPFVPENASRLSRMGWFAVAGNVVMLVVAGLGTRIADLSEDFKGDISIETGGFDGGGVILILVLFILARVFRHGAAMREDLEGTV